MTATSEKDQVRIFDTTLRDGEQSPGASMTLEEKLQIAEILDDMGVDIIEAGFPIASNGDFEAVSEIAKRSKNSVIAGLARAIHADIDRCGEAVKHAGKGRIHTFVSTSPIHLKFQMNKTEEQVLEIITDTVTRSRNLIDDVEWSAMDATRTPIEYLCRCVEAAIKCGATTINLPDTVGYATPDEYKSMFEQIRERVPNADQAIFSVHCHNDLGLAVANSLAGVAGGARQIECTINGLGERAGNAALEEIVMAIRTRSDVLPYMTQIDPKFMVRASKMVAGASGFAVQYNKAIVGKNAFAHESGIHQDGMLKNKETFEIMRPEDVGLAGTSLPLGKHSGRAALRAKLKDLGVEVGDNQLKDIFVRFKDLADRKKEVYDEDILALVTAAMTDGADHLEIVSLKVTCGTGGPAEATLEMEVGGEEMSATEHGDGPVDATFKAVRALYPNKARLQLYQVHAVTEGTDAQATVSVRLEEDGKIATGQSADTDTVYASAKAYVNALNRLHVRRSKTGTDQKEISYKDIG